jgi:hypothetical protein
MGDSAALSLWQSGDGRLPGTSFLVTWHAAPPSTVLNLPCSLTRYVCNVTHWSQVDNVGVS